MTNRTQIRNMAGVAACQKVATASEAQSVTGTATAGSFSLRFGDQTTIAMVFNVTAAVMQTNLRALSNISDIGVVCTGGALGTAPIVVTFAAEYGGVDVPLLAVTASSLTGGTVTIATTTPLAARAFFDADMDNVEAMRARLTAISATTFSAAQLDKMTMNDLVFALRVYDNPQTIK